MIDFLYKDNTYFFFVRHCYIHYYSLCSNSEFGCNVYIIYNSFVDNKDYCFTHFIEDDIENINICIKRISDEQHTTFV